MDQTTDYDHARLEVGKNLGRRIAAGVRGEETPRALKQQRRGFERSSG
jgi:hypothetical protein